MNVLVITYGVPYPPHSGARMRDFYLLRALATQHTVTCVCLMEPADTSENLAALEGFGITAFGFRSEKETLWERAAGVLQHVAARRPWATLAFRNAKMFARVQQLAASGTFDVVQIEHSLGVVYLDALGKAFRGKTILDLHNIAARQYRELWRLHKGFADRFITRVKHQLLKNWETNYVARFDRVLTVSEDDARWLKARNAAVQVRVIENGVDTDGTPFLAEQTPGARLLFVGTLGYFPNRDAAAWFCEAILPLIQAELPGTTVELVGRRPRAETRALGARRGVRVSADVENVEPFYRAAQVIIVPLRAGGGTRLKILEAMAYGRAVVSTRIGSEGLDVTDGETIALADTPQEFASKVVALLRDRAARERMAQAARARVEARYGWKKIGNHLLKLYEELGAVSCY